MDEATVVSDWLDAFHQLFGVPATLSVLAPPTPDGPADLTALSYPLVFDQDTLVGRAGHITHVPALVAHAHALGYAWDPEGRIVTVPTPASFNTLVPLTAGPDLGFLLTPVLRQTASPPPASALLHALDGVLAVPFLDHALLVSRLADSTAPARNRDLHFLMASTVHALSVLAFNTHLAPRSTLTDLGARVRAALPERVARWSQPDAPAPLTLQRFYHHDLQQYAHAVWWRSETPADFARVFTHPDNLQQLHAALDTRLTETRAGLGDIPSGDMNAMPPLTPVTFTLSA